MCTENVLYCAAEHVRAAYIITVSTVHLQTVQFVQYLYSKLLCSKTLDMISTMSLCEQQSAVINQYVSLLVFECHIIIH